MSSGPQRLGEEIQERWIVRPLELPTQKLLPGMVMSILLG